MRRLSKSFVFATVTAVLCRATALSGAETLSELLFSNSYQYAYGLAAADLTGDGKPDIVSADAVANKLYLYQNLGNGSFSSVTIDQNESGLLERMAIGDIDNDGKPDIAIVKNQIGWPNAPDPMRGELWWYKNPGPGGAWIQTQISSYFPRAYDVAFGDFNLDGKIDLAASSYVGGKVSWFENPGNNNLWTEHNLASGVGETRTARVADFNGDNKLDVLATSRSGGSTIWYENKGSSTWTSHNIDTSSVAPTHGQPWDIDADGDSDVVMALGYHVASQFGQVVWYENKNQGAMWTKHTIGVLPFGFEATVGDINGDGNPDVVATAFSISTNGEHVVWFENSGSPSGSWIKHVLKQNWYGANSVIVFDANANGTLDIVASAESTSNEVRWWRNDSGLQGDFNNDSTVSAADYVVWRRNAGTQPAYVAWRAHFEQSIPVAGQAIDGSSTVVPEPSSCFLLILGLMASSCRGRVFTT